MYEHLNLRAWPFQVVPDEEFAAVWAGRPETKKQLERLLRKMQFLPKSGLHLLWANFGMGKTHTLLHIQHLCRQTKNGLITVYAPMPTKARGFIEVYRAIVSQMPYDFLGKQLRKVGSTCSGSVKLHAMFRQSQGVVNALLAINDNDAEKASAAHQWLVAQPGLTARHLRTVGVSYRIKTPEDAVNALSAMTSLATFGSRFPSKLVVMLDEYQSIGVLTPKVRHEINAGMHSYYNKHPKGLDVILSFSFGRKDNVIFLLSDELKSRVELQTISLDLLSQAEAIEFIRDLLAQFRMKDDERWAFPFAPDAVRALVGHIVRQKALTPRRLMQYASDLLSEIYLARDPECSEEISAGQVVELLANPDLGMIDRDE